MGKEILFKALKHEKTGRTPWVPFSGIHSGKLLKYDAIELLKDDEKLFQSLLEVNKLYRPDGQPIIFDLQVEAEILGCELQWTKDCPPVVINHPLSQDKSIPDGQLIPKETDGRLPLILNVMKKMKAAVGETTALYGLICGPLTLSSHLRGSDIFTDMYDDEEYMDKLLNFCTKVSLKMAEMYLKAGMDVIAVVDPLVSQISRRHFFRYLHERYREIFAHIRNQGAFSSFFVCGDATRNIESMCLTKPDSISVDENVNIIEAKKITDKYNIAIGGNIPLTTVMLYGTQTDNMKYTVDLISAMNTSQNFILAPGCDMPYDTPIENAIGVAQAVLEYEQTKEILKNYVASDFSDIAVELPNYQALSKPLVEVFTLDSATCAACTYMMKVATAAKAVLGDKIDLREYKYTIKENIIRCKKLGVKNLPSIYINGELKYSSLIPDMEELLKEINGYFK